MRTLTENTQVIHATKGWYLHQIQQYRLWKATYLKCVVVHLYGLPRWHSGKESACKCGRHKRCGFNPWIRKTPWSRKWNPTPDSCLENSIDRGPWWAIVHGVAKSWIQLSTKEKKNKICVYIYIYIWIYFTIYGYKGLPMDIRVYLWI